jgi:alkylhydroperoxidase family enzyme
MRIPDWTPQAHPQPAALVRDIMDRRGGKLINLDKALLWSEPVASGWNVYLRNVRTCLSLSPKLRELGICTVALITGAHYEYHHHAPDFITAGGTQGELHALEALVKGNPCQRIEHPGLGLIERLVVQYAAQMTIQVKVDEALFHQLASHFTTTEMLELTTVVATYNMVARILVALQISPEED